MLAAMQSPGSSTARYAATVAGLLLLAGCGAGPTPSPPGGVDGLVIPTPDPRPGDFTTRIDNPWLPLHPGSSSTFAVVGTGRTRTITVTADTKTIDGVDTVVVDRALTSGRGRELERTEAYYAQDRSGNVWLFGESGPQRSWTAGEDGAEAGLAMPAHPRLGDGWRGEYADGVAEDVIRVNAIHQQREVPAGDFQDVLVLDVSSPLTPGSRVRTYFTQGKGLISSVPFPGASEDLTTP
jgi:hypothetical protein